VLRRVQVPLNDAAFGALVSFAFNAGLGNLGQSTLLRKLNAGDRAGAAEQFLVWNKGRVRGVLTELPGLTRRRRAERALFLGESWRAAGAVSTTRSRTRTATPVGEDARIRPETPQAEAAPRMRRAPAEVASKRAATKAVATKKVATKEAAATKPRTRQRGG
jgi:lysozyme